MVSYTCEKYDMALKASCDVPLKNDYLKLDDGSEVQISICLSFEGKIKSPQCCGQDMSCAM